MNIRAMFISAAMALFCAGSTLAQAPPTAAPDQLALLKSSDPKLAANKKLVFDMYRTILAAGHFELVPQFFTPGYIQHNPNVESGRDNLAAFIKQSRPVRPIQALLTFPMIAMMAEGDLVTIAVVNYADDPENPGKRYSNTHFDMFRIENGKIAEHWDHVAKSKAALTFDPNATSKP